MRKITYVAIVTAGIATAVIGVRTMSSPITASSLGFIAWAVSPYCYLAFMAWAVSKSASEIAVLALSLIVGGFGVWALVDAMFIHVDAQGGLIYIVAPLWQWVLLLLATLPVYFLNKARNA